MTDQTVYEFVKEMLANSEANGYMDWDELTLHIMDDLFAYSDVVDVFPQFDEDTLQVLVCVAINKLKAERIVE